MSLGGSEQDIFPLFLLNINDLPDVTCNIAIYADNTTLDPKCDQVSDLWQQLELASELESDLQDIMDWYKKWLVDFSAAGVGNGLGKLVQLV